MTFQPGKSGNPGGKPKGVAEVRELAQSLTVRAVKELERIAFNSPDDRARLAAIKEILDRAYGKPTQPIDGDGVGGGITVVVRRFGDEDADDDDVAASSMGRTANPSASGTHRRTAQ